MLNGLMIIMKKELRRVFTDRGLVFVNFVLPMLSIAVIYSLMGLMIDRTVAEIETHVTVLAAQNLPVAVAELIEAHPSIELAAADFEINPETVTAALLAGEIDYYLYFPADFSERVGDYSALAAAAATATATAAATASVDGGAVSDPETSSAAVAVAAAGITAEENHDLPLIEGRYSPKRKLSVEADYKIDALLNDYRQQILAERLGDSAYLAVYRLESAEIDIPDDSKGIAGGLENLIPMLISIFLFSGAMGIGMDCFAGEKERGTLATMLLTPLDRSIIIGGKILSLAVVSMISMTSSFLGILLSIPFSSSVLSPAESLTAADLALGWTGSLLLIICMLGLVGIYVTIISVLSLKAGSVKEAGGYISPGFMVVMLMGFLSMFSSTEEIATVNFFIPVYNNITNMKLILSGDAQVGAVLISLLTSVVLTLALLVYARRLIHQEKVVFPS